MKKSILLTCTLTIITLGCSPDDHIINIECSNCTDKQLCCQGICTDITQNPLHCGECQNICEKDEICANSTCQVVTESCGTCPHQTSCCSDTCANLKSDPNHCGKCHHKCPDHTQCIDGNCIDINPETCQTQCDNNKICCNNTCVYTDFNPNHCGECNHTCKPNELCQNGTCICQPKSCTDIPNACGMNDDGCGNTLNCGACPDTPCTPQTCEQLGIQCGNTDDGCGNTLNCGTCPDTPCTPQTCEQLGIQCGNTDDGCGNTLNCGTCTDGQTCTQGTCVCAPKTCQNLGFNCGNTDDGCGNTLNCGTCTDGQTCQNNVCKIPPVRDTYPKRKSIKGLQPDFQDVNQVIGNETHGVAMNLVWDFWQPTKKTECSSGEFKYDGYCFSPNNPNGNPQATANAIKTYADAGVIVTAVIYGVPTWARRTCTSGTVMADWFCAPKDENAQDYGRFVGFLAHYFNGENGHGRIADFVIHNEVNASEWFNIGCTKGTCDVDHWTSVYADSWNAAYDYARKEQKQAKVLISFEHHFGSTYDTMLNNQKPVVSAQTFLTKLVPKLGNRDWRIAWHSYPPNLATPNFSANDWPRITFGNIGVIAGWLRQHYPNDPHAWEIQLTENGINGNGASMQQQQKTQLCQAFENILGTPGIESFIYHRLIDIAEEGLNLGLWNADKTPKPAWETFALANRNLGNGWPACGFQYLPYIRMKRGSNASGMHWITTRQFPSGFNFERSWKILREPAENTKLVYECRVGGANGNHAMISPDPACEGQFNMGPLGYVYNTQVTGTSPIYRCRTSNGSHFVSPAANCEGQIQESLVGYAIQE